MTLNEIVHAEHIVPELKAVNRWEAIDELVDTLVSNGAIAKSDRDAVIDVVRTRENSMSTGIGYGIGIPHASTDLIENVVGALGRSKNGINFEALDNQPVTLVVLFLVPQGQFQKQGLLIGLQNHSKILIRKKVKPGIQNQQIITSLFMDN